LDAQVLNATVWPLPGDRYGVATGLSKSGGDQGLRLFDLRDGTQASLLPAATLQSGLTVTRDGARLAYTTQTHGFGLAELPLDGSPARLLTSEKLDQHSVAWSPRADQFVFATLDELIVRDGKGSSEKVLVTPKDFPDDISRPMLGSIVYSPDGTRILFTCSGCEPGLSIWAVPAGGGALARIARGNPDGGYAATFSPDAQWIAFNHTRLGQSTILAKLRIGSGDHPQPVHTTACVTPAWSPVSDWIACNGPNSLELIPAHGGTPRKLGDRVGPIAWSRDGKRILYLTMAPQERTQLAEVNVETGAHRVLSTFDRDYASSSPIGTARLSLSPDGKSVAASVLVQDGDIWILNGFRQPRTLWERLWPRN